MTELILIISLIVSLNTSTTTEEPTKKAPIGVVDIMEGS